MSSSSGRPRLEPVNPDQRIALLDVLRGFALTGVLLVNMMSYGASDEIWEGSVDRSFRLMEFFFFEHRFWHLFSLLFGIGFAIQLLRAEAKGVRFVPLYLRRLFFLFGFGAATNILWRVDILTDYAVLGLLLIPLRRWSARAVLVAAVVTQLAPPVVGVVREMMDGHAQDQAVVAAAVEQTSSQAAPGPTWADEEHRLRAQGSFPQVVAGHARRYVTELRNPDLQPSLGNWWGYLAMFILGLYVGKRRILQDFRRHRRLVRIAGWTGLGLGAIGVGLSTWQEFGGASSASWPLWLLTLAGAVTLLGYTGMMCFYVYAMCEWASTGRWRWLQDGFAAVGRTALSNYLLQALVINVIFMAWGLGYYQKLGPAATMLLSVPVYSILMLVSVWWIGRFRYGPAEWLWRSLTYGSAQPMRIHTEGNGR